MGSAVSQRFACALLRVTPTEQSVHRMVLQCLPEVLIVQLRRWSGAAHVKSDKHVSIDTEIALTDGVGQTVKYHLYAMVEHQGPCHGGHYVTYLRVRKLSSSIICRDTLVTDWSSLLRTPVASGGRWTTRS